MSIGTAIFVILLLGWLYSLSITIYNIQYPKSCQHPLNSEQYRTKCFEPAFKLENFVNETSNAQEKALEVEITIFAYESKTANIRRPKMAPVIYKARHLLSHKNPLSATVTLPVTKATRIDKQFIHGIMMMNYVGSGEESRPSEGISIDFAFTALRTPKVYQQRNLLESSNNAQSTASDSSLDPIQHLKYGRHPLHVRIVDFGDITLSQTFLPYLHEQLNSRYVRTKNRDENNKYQHQMVYDPVVFVDDLSLMSSQIIQFSNNVSAPNPNITLKIDLISPVYYGYKKMMMSTLETMKQIIPNEDDLDEMKYWISDDRLYQFVLTQIITWLHIIFEFLAFKDDWKFFVGRKSHIGISLSSLMFSLFRNVIIFLYLADMQTSWLILGSLLKDILFSMYKISSVSKLQFIWGRVDDKKCITNNNPQSSSILHKENHIKIPFIPLTLKYLSLSSTSEEERETLYYDYIAITHVSLLVYPMAIGLSIYFLLYYTYKSWWSWIISSLADIVYFFGFVSLTPQLYINYRLKSVAHLPVKAFMYKIFITFVDDVFAFIIKSPLKHKIMTLRDDVVFLIFVYQWWIYPSDKSRANEFGFQYDENKPIENQTDKTIDSVSDSQTIDSIDSNNVNCDDNDDQGKKNK